MIRLAFDDEILPFFWELLEGHIGRDLKMAAHLQQIVLRFQAVAGLPRFDHTARQCFGAIGQSAAIIDADDPAESTAGRASSHRIVEAEERWRGVPIFNVTLGAME